MKSGHKFIILITGSVVIAMCCVMISMFIYGNNGSKLLDLSRPENQRPVTETTDKDKFERFDGYSNSGEIDEKALKEFQKHFTKYADDALTVEAYDPAVLSDKSLGINDPDLP